MEIKEAKIENAELILNLQKLAYISEAKIVGDYNIPPFTQTLEEIIEEFKQRLILKAVVKTKRLLKKRLLAR